MPELRAATSAEHQALEDLVAVTQRVVKPEGYENLLQAFLGFYRPLEAVLARYSWPPELEFEARRKTPWLVQDLQACGAATEAIPECGELPNVSDEDRAWGCLYVIEGSTLGGQHISRFLDQHDIDPLQSCFFHSYGPKVPERWKQFLNLLDGYASEHEDHAGIIAGAVDTFIKLRLWFRDSLAQL